MTQHVAVWLDHREARIFEVAPEALHSEVVKPRAHPHEHGHRYHQTRHAEAEAKFYADVAAALGHPDAVLVVGPGMAKLEFMRWLHNHAPSLEARVRGVETVDHPSDGQLLAYARHYFHEAELPLR